MGEYEPRDSRIVTQNPSNTPIEPQRTGPREDQARPGSQAELPKTRQPKREEEAAEEEDRWAVDEDDKCWPAGQD